MTARKPTPSDHFQVFFMSPGRDARPQSGGTFDSRAVAEAQAKSKSSPALKVWVEDDHNNVVAVFGEEPRPRAWRRRRRA